MDRALNRQILIELEFLLKNDRHINEDISDLASEKWKEFKGEVSWLGKEAGLAAKNIAKGDITRVKEFGKAISLGANDAVSLFEKDPRALIQGFIDIVSLVEPTGIADIINAGIYLYNNEKTMGIISLITGGLSAIGAIASIAGGAGLPIIILGKTIKIIRIAKDSSKLYSMCTKLMSFFPKIIEKIKIVTNSMPSLKPVETEALGFYARLKNAMANKAGFQNFDNMFNYLFGGGRLESGLKTINSKEFAEKTMSIVGQGGGLVGTASGLAASGAAFREYEEKREQAEKKVRSSSQYCKITDCSTIYYDEKQKKYINSSYNKPSTTFESMVSLYMDS